METRASPCTGTGGRDASTEKASRVPSPPPASLRGLLPGWAHRKHSESICWRKEQVNCWRSKWVCCHTMRFSWLCPGRSTEWCLLSTSGTYWDGKFHTRQGLPGSLFFFFLTLYKLHVWTEVFSSSFTSVHINSFNYYLASGEMPEPVCYHDTLVCCFIKRHRPSSLAVHQDHIFFKCQQEWNDFDQFEANCSIFFPSFCWSRCI